MISLSLTIIILIFDCSRTRAGLPPKATPQNIMKEGHNMQNMLLRATFAAFQLSSDIDFFPSCLRTFLLERHPYRKFPSWNSNSVKTKRRRPELALS